MVWWDIIDNPVLAILQMTVIILFCAAVSAWTPRPSAGEKDDGYENENL